MRQAQEAVQIQGAIWAKAEAEESARLELAMEDLADLENEDMRAEEALNRSERARARMDAARLESQRAEGVQRRARLEAERMEATQVPEEIGAERLARVA